eukprot:scaffold3046_cov30-Tisochrysis_lutea.AAC.1
MCASVFCVAACRNCVLHERRFSGGHQCSDISAAPHIPSSIMYSTVQRVRELLMIMFCTVPRVKVLSVHVLHSAGRYGPIDDHVIHSAEIQGAQCRGCRGLGGISDTVLHSAEGAEGAEESQGATNNHDLDSADRQGTISFIPACEGQVLYKGANQKPQEPKTGLHCLPNKTADGEQETH